MSGDSLHLQDSRLGVQGPDHGFGTRDARFVLWSRDSDSGPEPDARDPVSRTAELQNRRLSERDSGPRSVITERVCPVVIAARRRGPSREVPLHANDPVWGQAEPIISGRR